MIWRHTNARSLPGRRLRNTLQKLPGPDVMCRADLAVSSGLSKSLWGSPIPSAGRSTPAPPEQESGLEDNPIVCFRSLASELDSGCSPRHHMMCVMIPASDVAVPMCGTPSLTLFKNGGVARPAFVDCCVYELTRCHIHTEHCVLAGSRLLPLLTVSVHMPHSSSAE